MSGLVTSGGGPGQSTCRWGQQYKLSPSSSGAGLRQIRLGRTLEFDVKAIREHPRIPFAGVSQNRGLVWLKRHA